MKRKISQEEGVTVLKKAISVSCFKETWGGWHQPAKLLLNWAGVNVPLSWLSGKNGGVSSKGPVFLPKSLHHGTGLTSWIIWRLWVQGRGETYPTSHTMSVAESPRALPSTPGCLLCGKYLLGTSCVCRVQCTPTCLCAFGLTLRLPSALPSLLLSPGSLSLVFLDTIHVTLLGSVPSAPLPPRTQPSCIALSGSSRPLCGCPCHGTYHLIWYGGQLFLVVCVPTSFQVFKGIGLVLFICIPSILYDSRYMAGAVFIFNISSITLLINYVPGIVLSIYHMLLIITINLWARYYHSHFAEGKTEAQNG